MTPVTHETHQALGWRPACGFHFAKSIALQRVGVLEIAQAAQTMPIAFSNDGGSWGAVAVMGPPDVGNLYVDDGGRWLGGYIPSALRFYPFIYSHMQLHLWADFVAEPATVEGVQPFFEGEAVAPNIKRVAVSLGGLAKADDAAQPVFEILFDADALVPWAPLIPRDLDVAVNYQGLWQLDRARFDGMSDQSWLSIRRYNAHGWLHAHMDSLPLARRFAAIEARKLSGQTIAHPAPMIATGKPRDEVADFLFAVSKDLEAKS